MRGLAVLLLDWFSKLNSLNDILLITNFSREKRFKIFKISTQAVRFQLQQKLQKKHKLYTIQQGDLAQIQTEVLHFPENPCCIILRDMRCKADLLKQGY